MDPKLYGSAVVVIPQDEDAQDEYEWPEEMPPLSVDHGDLSDGPSLRHKAYAEVWAKCSTKIQTLVRQIYAQITDDLIEFMCDTYIENDSLILPYPEIPVALVVGDSSLTSTIFDTLSRQVTLEKLGKSRIPSFATIHMTTKDFSSIIAAMRALVTGFTSQSLGAELPKKRANATNLTNHDISMLLAWYEHILAADSTSNSKLRLIVFIADIELCEPDVLRDFVHICSLYVPQLPLVLVIGTATSSSIIQTTLPLGARARLAVEAFQLQSGLPAFEILLRGLFLDWEFDLGLRLTAQAYEYIRDSYTRHEQSIDSFISTLQLLLMTHFMLPNSVFCSSDMLGTESDALKRLRHPSSSNFLRSLRTAVEHNIATLPNSSASVQVLQQILPQSAMYSPTENKRAKKAAGSIDDLGLLGYVTLAREEFNEHMMQFKLALRLLRLLALEVRHHTGEMRVALTALLGASLHGILLREDVRAVVDRIKVLPLERLQRILRVIIEFLETLPEDISSRSYVKALLIEVETWTESLVTANEVATKTPSPKKPTASAGVALFGLGSTMLGGGHLTNSSAVSEVAKTIALRFHEFFEQNLKSTDVMPMSDIWILHSGQNPMELLNPAPRASISSALVSTHNIAGLPDEVAQVIEADTENLGVLPDTAVVFRRYLDSGRTINTYDWFESFVLAMQEDRNNGNFMDVDSNGGDVDHRDELDDMAGDGKWRKEVQARFLHSIHELDWLGLLKSTGRKRDHVVRTLYDPPPR